MKSKHFQKLLELQREHQRRRPWKLNAHGFYVPHVYDEVDPRGPSWWDDVGFVLRGRRHIVWWRHPRYVYSSELESRAFEAAGPFPQSQSMLDGAVKRFRTVGRSRKKVTGYELAPLAAGYREYFDRVRSINKELSEEGINYVVGASLRWEWFPWAMCMQLIAPLEVRNEQEAEQLAVLAKRLAANQTTLEKEFPRYQYSKEDWLQDEARRKQLIASAGDG